MMIVMKVVVIVKLRLSDCRFGNVVLKLMFVSV